MNETIQRVYVTGYQSYELGIFSEQDPRVQVIKNVLKKELTALIENGLQWVMKRLEITGKNIINYF